MKSSLSDDAIKKFYKLVFESAITRTLIFIFHRKLLYRKRMLKNWILKKNRRTLTNTPSVSIKPYEHLLFAIILVSKCWTSYLILTGNNYEKLIFLRLRIGKLLSSSIIPK